MTDCYTPCPTCGQALELSPGAKDELKAARAEVARLWEILDTILENIRRKAERDAARAEAA